MAISTRTGNPHIKLTEEQIAIVQSDAMTLCVQALAGVGKTETLRRYGDERTHERGLYLVYNRAAATQAQQRFGRHVECKTIHSVAFAAVGRPFAAAKKLGDLKAIDLHLSFGWDIDQCDAVLQTVMSFLFSADPKIAPVHVPALIPDAEASSVLRKANQVWANMNDLSNQSIPMPHDGYLKLFQLSNPVLDYDFILLDEAQDANPATAAIVLSQSCRKVLVGDRHQGIYRFRRSINSMALAQGAQTLPLTQSFRFGPWIAAVANAILRTFKAESSLLVGASVLFKNSARFDSNKQFAWICRKNSTVFREAIDLLDRKKVYFVDGAEQYRLELFIDVYRLWRDDRSAIKSVHIRKFKSFSSLESYANTIEDTELKSAVSVVEKHGNQVPYLIERVCSEQVKSMGDADVILTTVHRCKGMEFRQVRLANDFVALQRSGGELKVFETPEEIEEVNLHYVAVTRAQAALELSEKLQRALIAIKAGKRPVKAPAALINAPQSLHLDRSPTPQRYQRTPVKKSDTSAALQAGATYLFRPSVQMVNKVGRAVEAHTPEEAIGRTLLFEPHSRLAALSAAAGLTEAEALDVARALLDSKRVNRWFFEVGAKEVLKHSPAMIVGAPTSMASHSVCGFRSFACSEHADIGRQMLKLGPHGFRQLLSSHPSQGVALMAAIHHMVEHDVLNRNFLKVGSSTSAQPAS